MNRAFDFVQEHPFRVLLAWLVFLVVGHLFTSDGHTYVMFSNDGPYGVMASEESALPYPLTGAWATLNWMGNEDLPPPLSVTTAMRLFSPMLAWSLGGFQSQEDMLPFAIGGFLLAAYPAAFLLLLYTASGPYVPERPAPMPPSARSTRRYNAVSNTPVAATGRLFVHHRWLTQASTTVMRLLGSLLGMAVPGGPFGQEVEPYLIGCFVTIAYLAMFVLLLYEASGPYTVDKIS